jgi:hypothetical protein
LAELGGEDVLFCELRHGWCAADEHGDVILDRAVWMVSRVKTRTKEPNSHADSQLALNPVPVRAMDLHDAKRHGTDARHDTPKTPVSSDPDIVSVGTHREAVMNTVSAAILLMGESRSRRTVERGRRKM